MQKTAVQFLAWEDALEKVKVPTPLFFASLVAQTVKKSL